MKKGDKFSSILDLEQALKEFEKYSFTNLTKSRSRTIEGAKKTGLKRFINPRLEYTEIDYVCIKSGTYASTSKGARPKQSSYRDECHVQIRVRITDDGEEFVIKEFEGKHNQVNSLVSTAE